MHRFLVAVVGAGATAAAALAGAGLRGVSAGAADPAPGSAAFYSAKVRPILMQNCGKCHFNMSHKGGLSMETRASMMKGGRDGVVVIPGDPAKSLIVRLVRHEGPANDPMPMPPKSPKIDDSDIAVITEWVKAGAMMPDRGK